MSTIDTPDQYRSRFRLLLMVFHCEADKPRKIDSLFLSERVCVRLVRFKCSRTFPKVLQPHLRKVAQAKKDVCTGKCHINTNSYSFSRVFSHFLLSLMLVNVCTENCKAHPRATHHRITEAKKGALWRIRTRTWEAFCIILQLVQSCKKEKERDRRLDGYV